MKMNFAYTKSANTRDNIANYLAQELGLSLKDMEDNYVYVEVIYSYYGLSSVEYLGYICVIPLALEEINLNLYTAYMGQLHKELNQDWLDQTQLSLTDVLDIETKIASSYYNLTNGYNNPEAISYSYKVSNIKNLHQQYLEKIYL